MTRSELSKPLAHGPKETDCGYVNDRDHSHPAHSGEFPRSSSVDVDFEQVVGTTMKCAIETTVAASRNVSVPPKTTHANATLRQLDETVRILVPNTLFPSVGRPKGVVRFSTSDCTLANKKHSDGKPRRTRNAHTNATTCIIPKILIPTRKRRVLLPTSACPQP